MSAFPIPNDSAGDNLISGTPLASLLLHTASGLNYVKKNRGVNLKHGGIAFPLLIIVCLLTIGTQSRNLQIVQLNDSPPGPILCAQPCGGNTKDPHIESIQIPLSNLAINVPEDTVFEEVLYVNPYISTPSFSPVFAFLKKYYQTEMFYVDFTRVSYLNYSSEQKIIRMEIYFYRFTPTIVFLEFYLHKSKKLVELLSKDLYIYNSKQIAKIDDESRQNWFKQANQPVNRILKQKIQKSKIYSSQAKLIRFARYVKDSQIRYSFKYYYPQSLNMELTYFEHIFILQANSTIIKPQRGVRFPKQNFIQETDNDDEADIYISMRPIVPAGTKYKLLKAWRNQNQTDQKFLMRVLIEINDKEYLYELVVEGVLPMEDQTKCLNIRKIVK